MTTPANDIPRIDWKAERDAMRAPAYFARVTSYDAQRGENAGERAERAERTVKRRESQGDEQKGTSDGIDME